MEFQAVLDNGKNFFVCVFVLIVLLVFGGVGGLVKGITEFLGPSRITLQ